MGCFPRALVKARCFHTAALPWGLKFHLELTVGSLCSAATHGDAPHCSSSSPPPAAPTKDTWLTAGNWGHWPSSCPPTEPWSLPFRVAGKNWNTGSLEVPGQRVFPSMEGRKQARSQGFPPSHGPSLCQDKGHILSVPAFVAPGPSSLPDVGLDSAGPNSRTAASDPLAFFWGALEEFRRCQTKMMCSLGTGVLQKDCEKQIQI